MSVEWRGVGRSLVSIGDLLSLAVCLTLVTLGLVGADGGDNVWYMALVGVLTAVTAFVIVTRRPENRFGDLLSLLALTIAVTAAIQALIPAATSPQARAWLVVASDAFFAPFYVQIFVALPLIYPTGEPLTGRWGILVTLGFVWATAVFSLSLFAERVCIEFVEGTDQCITYVANPSGLGFLPEELATPIFAVGLPLAIAAVSGLFVRYRRSSGVERLQIRWLFFSVALASGTFLFSITTVQEALGLTIPSPVLNAMLGFAFATIPLSCGFAILRYRLYDIDRLVSRTVTYAAVVGVLVGVVALVAALVSTRFDSPVVVAATTLGVAAAFNPLRRRVQAIVDRRFNRSHFSAERVMDEFARSLRDEVDSEMLVDGWIEVVSETMHPNALGVWVKTS